MKCQACNSKDVTLSKNKCHECRYIYEEEQKLKKTKKEKKDFNNTLTDLQIEQIWYNHAH